MNKEFHIGDNIVITKSFDSIKKGVTGRIVCRYPHGPYYSFGIELDEKYRNNRSCVGRHNLNGTLPEYTGYWAPVENIDIIHKEIPYDPNQLEEDGDL